MDTQDMSDLWLLLLTCYRSVEARMVTALTAAGFPDLTAAQARVLLQLNDEGSRLTALATRARVTKPTMGELVDQLVTARYVQRTVDPRDSRARLVRLAGRGHAALPIAAAAAAQVEAEWASHIGAQDMAMLHDTMARIHELVQAGSTR